MISIALYLDHDLFLSNPFQLICCPIIRCLTEFRELNLELAKKEYELSRDYHIKASNAVTLALHFEGNVVACHRIVIDFPLIKAYE
jgi:hypothetical protein